MKDLENSKIKHSKPIQSFVFGGIAGCIGKTVVAPFDRVKILFQAQNPQFQQFSGKFFGVFQAVYKIYEESGIFHGLYRGHSLTLLRIFPYAAIQFTAFERFKRVLNVNFSKFIDEKYLNFFSGSLAGTTAVTLTYPLDVMRVRLVYNTSSAANSFCKFEKILQFAKEKNLFKSLYAGYLPTIVGIIPYAGTSFFVFEFCKEVVDSSRYDFGPISKLICGTIAGLFGQTVAYPIDVVRRRYQLRAEKGNPAQSIFSIIRQIYRTNGFFRGFFVGLSINYLKAAPATGVSFFVYECFKSWMEF